MVKTRNADILENTLRQTGDLLDILLLDRTTGRNIIWATDSYESLGKAFAPREHIRPELVTGKIYGKLIQPRAVKSQEEQRRRTKEKGEVFTPLKIVDQMNKLTDSVPVNKQNWQTYVAQLKLEITCGEAPFIVSRYNPVAHGEVIKIKSRVGFLDRKLQVVSKYCTRQKEWLKWARVAYQSSYGYEWQGDSLLIARENLLYTLIDYYKEKFKKKPSLVVQRNFAEIISWNIFQMDGLKYVVPMSCKTEFRDTLFDQEKVDCAGCKLDNVAQHNGIYVKVMDWVANKELTFASLLKQ